MIAAGGHMKGLCRIFYNTDIGTLEITGTEEGIISINYIDTDFAPQTCIPDCLKECIKQLDEYFTGKRKKFDLLLIPEGTEFQKKIWDALLSIQFGMTATYGDIAAKTGNAKACRAVGNANNKNRIAIVIPCHRVVGGDGKLTGYAGGLWRKEWLLAHERKINI